jgi:hypothetical protein
MTIFESLATIKDRISCLTSPYSEYIYKCRKTTRNRALVLIDYQEFSSEEA